MTPQEQVKMLREVLEAGLRTEPGWRADAGRALAATAPPKPYHFILGGQGEKDAIRVGSPSAPGGARWVLTFYADAHDCERDACLAALNALAEKENAR